MKETLKLALKALETERDIYREYDEDGAPEYILEAITTIEQALAQPAQEPVAWLEPEWGEKICPEVGYEVTMTDDHPRDLCWIPLYPHPPQRTEQEPVAWMQVTKYGNKLLAFTEPPLEPPCYTEEFIAAKNYPLFLKKENT